VVADPYCALKRRQLVVNMGGLQKWRERRPERRADRKALRAERAEHRRERGGDASALGYIGIGKGSKNKRATSGTGGS
jgi:hypothetical protein